MRVGPLWTVALKTHCIPYPAQRIPYWRLCLLSRPAGRGGAPDRVGARRSRLSGAEDRQIGLPAGQRAPILSAQQRADGVREALAHVELTLALGETVARGARRAVVDLHPAPAVDGAGAERGGGRRAGGGAAVPHGGGGGVGLPLGSGVA